MRKVNLGLICLLLAIPCYARTITVDCNGPADFNNIQAAIDAAVNGDTVVIAEGRYTGDGNRDIDFKGKAITVRSTDPNDWDVVQTTVIDCNGSASDRHRGFYFHNNETSSSVLTGLTITNGHAPIEAYGRGAWRSVGAGIYCSSSSPFITLCNLIRNCATNAYDEGFFSAGGAMWCNAGGNPIVKNCNITSNSSEDYGGATAVGGSATLTISSCTITDNSAGGSGGGIYSFSHPQGTTTMTNCILWGNRAPTGPEISGSATVSYSDVKGGFSGDGNINADPCFADPCNGDYHLQSAAGRWDPNSETWVIDANTSICIDAGNPGCPLGDEPNDANNIRINMGAYGGTAEASKSPANWRNIADLTNDWTVEFNDLKVFVDYWLGNGECIPSDLNRSQFVDFVDFGLMALHWLEDNNP